MIPSLPPLQLPPGMLIQPEEEQQDELAAAGPPEYQDEDEFEEQAAAADFDDSRPVGGLMVRRGHDVWTG